MARVHTAHTKNISYEDTNSSQTVCADTVCAQSKDRAHACANAPPKEDCGSSWARKALNYFCSLCFFSPFPEAKRRTKGKLKLTTKKIEEGGFIQEGRMVDQGKQKSSHSLLHLCIICERRFPSLLTPPRTHPHTHTLPPFLPISVHLCALCSRLIGCSD